MGLEWYLQIFCDSHQFLGGVPNLPNLQKYLEEMGAEVFLHAQVGEGEEVFLQAQVEEGEEVEERGAEVFLQAQVWEGSLGFQVQILTGLARAVAGPVAGPVAGSVAGSVA